MSRLLQRWDGLVARFGQLPRERRLLIALALGLLVSLPILSYQVLPQWQQHQQQLQQLQVVEQQIIQQQQAITALQQQLTADIDQPVKERIARQQQRLQKLKEASERYTLLDKNQRQQFLESTLDYPNTLELVSLASQSPEAIVNESGTVNLYRHQVNASYRGNYTELRLFFQQLREQHPDVTWQQFQYNVLDYPLAEVAIRWQLLSVDKEIIGG